MAAFVEFRRKANNYLEMSSFSTGCSKVIRRADAAASGGPEWIKSQCLMGPAVKSNHLELSFDSK